MEAGVDDGKNKQVVEESQCMEEFWKNGSVLVGLQHMDECLGVDE